MKKHIMIIEDNPQDYQMLIRSFEKIGLDYPVIYFDNGDDALDYLFKSDNEKKPDWTLPHFIFLDLNMPGMDGRDVLKHIKTNPVSRLIPTVVMTSSEKNSDIEICYDYGANTYVPKPMGMQDYLETVESIRNFWMDATIIPATA